MVKTIFEGSEQRGSQVIFYSFEHSFSCFEFAVRHIMRLEVFLTCASVSVMMIGGDIETRYQF